MRTSATAGAGVTVSFGVSCPVGKKALGGFTGVPGTARGVFFHTDVNDRFLNVTANNTSAALQKVNAQVVCATVDT